MVINRKTKLRTPPQGGFLHDYYTFESMHDGDHDGVVRIFVGLSCELGSLIIYYTPGRGKIVPRNVITLLVGEKLCRVI